MPGDLGIWQPQSRSAVFGALRCPKGCLADDAQTPLRQCRQPSLSTSVLKPSGSRGSAPSSTVLQGGQGMPAPPQLQPCRPPHGRRGWFSQTQPVSAQRTHFIVRTLALGQTPKRAPWTFEGHNQRQSQFDEDDRNYFPTGADCRDLRSVFGLGNDERKRYGARRSDRAGGLRLGALGQL